MERDRFNQPEQFENVILRTDPNAPYGAMMTVLDELRQSPEKRGWEISNLAIPTLSEQQNWY